MYCACMLWHIYVWLRQSKREREHGVALLPWLRVLLWLSFTHSRALVLWLCLSRRDRRRRCCWRRPTSNREWWLVFVCVCVCMCVLVVFVVLVALEWTSANAIKSTMFSSTYCSPLPLIPFCFFHTHTLTHSYYSLSLSLSLSFYLFNVQVEEAPAPCVHLRKWMINAFAFKAKGDSHSAPQTNKNKVHA